MSLQLPLIKQTSKITKTTKTSKILEKNIIGDISDAIIYSPPLKRKLSKSKYKLVQENLENTENIGNTENLENTENIQNLENAENAENAENIEEDEEDLYASQKMKKEIFQQEDLDKILADYISPDKISKVVAQPDKKIFEKTKYAFKGSFPEYYKKYHKQDELTRKGLSVSYSPSFNFLEAIKKNKIVPNPIGIIKRKGEESKVNLNHLRLGDNYLISLASSLHTSDHITELNLGQNRLTNLSVVPLLKSITENDLLCKKLTHLNLSFNKLGTESINSLCKYIEQRDCELTHINLEANALGKLNVIKLLDYITRQIYCKIRYLNLGQNLLDDEVATDLANLVTASSLLEVLILNSNLFKNYGGSIIISSLKRHTKMRVFDISWNSVGSNLLELIPTKEELMKLFKDDILDKQFFNLDLYELQFSKEVNLNYNKKKIKNSLSLFSKELGELFMDSSSELIHLDISHNNINYTDAVHLTECVKSNHTIFGIHCDGNEMTIDELGFLSSLNKSDYSQNHYAASQIHYKIDSEHPLIKSSVLNVRKIRAKNNCWICEGWKETKFIYKPQVLEEEELAELKINLHLSFENYKPYETHLKGDQFVCHRMCPPGETLFYYTINGVPVENYPQSLIYKLKDALVHTEVSGGETKQYIITKVAKINCDINPNVIDATSYKKLLKYCVPRPEKKIIKKVRIKTPWIFPISIWAAYDYKYEGDPGTIWDEAFEYDFNRCQFIKDTKTPEYLAELKDFLKGQYKNIIDCYRYYSTLLGSNLWQINKNYLLEFCNNCQNLLVDYTFNDVYIQVTTIINSPIDKEERTKNKNKNLPDNIIRHQFMSLLVKIARDKYFSRNAVKFSFENHYSKVFKNYDNHKWRIERYYNEPVDNVIKAYLPIFDGVFRSNASMKEIGKKETWMDLEEFERVMTHVVDSEFPVRDIILSFNFSIRLQVNEVESDRHTRLYFPEFLEAFCRVVDKYSPVSKDEVALNWTLQARHEQQLSTKLENVMHLMMPLISHSDYKYLRDKFVIPQRDEETELLKYDIFSPQYAAVWPKVKNLSKTIK